MLRSLERRRSASSRVQAQIPPEASEGPPGGGHATSSEVLQQVSGNRRVAQVLALEEHVDLAEGGAVGVGSLPALPHQVVDFLGAVGRLGQQNLARRAK